VPGIIRGQHTDIDDTVIEKIPTAHSSSTLTMSTDAPHDSSNAILDYTTYAVMAIAGLLILLFVIVLVGTILFFCHAKDKKGRYYYG
jgi:hypothetical protein